jgi:hypothetical protein
MAVVVNQKFIAKLSCFNYKPARPIWSQADHFANQPVARDFDWSKVANIIKAKTA